MLGRAGAVSANRPVTTRPRDAVAGVHSVGTRSAAVRRTDCGTASSTGSASFEGGATASSRARAFASVAASAGTGPSARCTNRLEGVDADEHHLDQRRCEAEGLRAHGSQQVLDPVGEAADDGATDGVGRSLQGVDRAEERGDVFVVSPLALQGEQRRPRQLEMLVGLGDEVRDDIGVLDEESLELTNPRVTVDDRGGVRRRVPSSGRVPSGRGRVGGGSDRGGVPGHGRGEGGPVLLPGGSDRVERGPQARDEIGQRAEGVPALSRGRRGEPLDDLLHHRGHRRDTGKPVQAGGAA